ncbi:PepSY domain-containing protein [Novosphingopyxis sp.]|uniref:PepSY domain-containing protein n=1 Tax=Novosphingopyxis sp. TaxID=2709690 RepID=UPI003B5CC622
MQKKIIATTLCALALGGAAIAGVTHQGHEAAPAARITMAEARAIAMKEAPGGVIAEAELEKEDGSWRYSFDIRQDGRIHEIGVDPQNGRIVENSWENARDEAHEAADEAKHGGKH